MVTLKYEIFKRSNTRSTSYSWNSIRSVLEQHGFDYTERRGMYIVHATKQVQDEEEAKRVRTEFEASLRSVHRNVAYRFELNQGESK